MERETNTQHLVDTIIPTLKNTFENGNTVRYLERLFDQVYQNGYEQAKLETGKEQTTFHADIIAYSDGIIQMELYRAQGNKLQKIAEFNMSSIRKLTCIKGEKVQSRYITGDKAGKLPDIAYMEKLIKLKQSVKPK